MDAITTNQSGYAIIRKIIILSIMTTAPKIRSDQLLHFTGLFFTAVFVIVSSHLSRNHVYISPVPVAFLDR